MAEFPVEDSAVAVELAVSAVVGAADSAVGGLDLEDKADGADRDRMVLLEIARGADAKAITVRFRSV
jgi:hypothetical protein